MDATIFIHSGHHKQGDVAALTIPVVSSALGLVAGAAGVAAMTVAEKIEQSITKRPNTYVPAHTLERTAGAEDRKDRIITNWAMHLGRGILLGAVR